MWQHSASVLFDGKLSELTRQMVEDSEGVSFAGHYKGYVARGNNGQIVKQLMKNRFWWLLSDQMEVEKLNLIWHQIRNKDVMR